MARKQKRAKARPPERALTGPRAALPTGSTQHERPLFCFRHVDTSTKEAWAFKPTEQHAGEILTFVCEIAGSTWAEIERMQTGNIKRHRKHHDQPIDSLVKEARGDLTRRKLDVVFGDSPIFRFRLGGEKRLWGYRQGNVFHVIWWDPEHKVYEQAK